MIHPGAQKAYTIRARIGLVLTLSYLLTLLITPQLACLCTAESAEGEVMVRVKNASGCVATTSSNCHTSAAPACPVALPESACDVSGEQCEQSAVCLTLDQSLPGDFKFSSIMDLVLAAPVIADFGAQTSPRAFKSVFHPPDLLRLAPHIPTTVLLC